MTMSSGSSTTPKEAAEEWSPESEIQLFLALEGLKPVGINKYFFMACISERLSKALNRDITTDAIWSHLKTMYNLAALDEMEPLPFPNTEREFALPEAEFSSLLKDRKKDTTTDGVSVTTGTGQTSNSSPSVTGASGRSEKGSHSTNNGSVAQNSTTTTTTNSTTTNNNNTSGANNNNSGGSSTSVSSSKEKEGQNTVSGPTTTTASASQGSSSSEEKRTSSSGTAASSSSTRQPASSGSVRVPKRTRGSMSLESNSPSTTPPPVPVNQKRRRI